MSEKDFETQSVSESDGQNTHLQTNETEPKTWGANSPVFTDGKFFIIILAFVAGIIGGLYGSLDLAKRPVFQRWFGMGGTVSDLSQNLVLDEQSATTEVVKKAGPAVVSIVIAKEVSEMPQYFFDPFGVFGQGSPNRRQGDSSVQEVGAGTGFFVSSDGLIVTNKHVVGDETASYSVVTNDGKSYEAKVLAKDPVNDIAIIKIDIKDAPFLEFADSSKLELGQHVVAIGNSLGQYQNTVTTGVVSGIGRSITAGGSILGLEQLEGVIQTDAAINSGNSGGPLLNLAGQVVGINTAVDRQGQSIGFALPSNDVKKALESYRQGGQITQPYLGVRYIMITDALAKANKLPKTQGALLARGETMTDFAVLPGSPADKAGLAENDIIIEIGGQVLSDEMTLSRAMKKFKPGDKVDAKVYSKGQEKIVQITIGETK